MIEHEEYHRHTCISNCLTQPDSTCFIEDYARTNRERGQHVLCISEHGNRSNVWQQFEMANKYSDESFTMKALAAAEAYFVPDRTVKEHRGYHLILVAKNMDGFYELNEILSEANLSGFYYHARVDFELLRRLNYRNFICTSACFRKGSLVKTLSGYKQIENITTNDYILNMHNKWEKVNFPTHRQYNGRGCKIYIRSEDNPIICTDTHKFLTSSISIYNYSKKKDIYPLRWVEAKDLHVDCLDSIKNYLLEPVNEILYTNNNVINKSEWKNKIVKRNYFVKNNLKETITITPELMRLFGLWIGDGHISFNEEKRYYRVGISFNEKEFDTYWNDFIALASEQIGIVWSKRIDTATKKIEITSSNIEFFEFMYFLFGNSKAKSKHIPKRLVNINKDFDFNLLFGILLSDGYFRTQEKDGYKYGQCTLASISSSLIQQFKYILEQYNIKTRKPLIKNEHVDKDNIHHQISYYFTISNNAFINLSKLNVHSNEQIIEIFEKAIKHNKHTLINVDGVFYKKKYIEKIEYFDMNEEVYCLNVDSHSFVCENVIVHNCVAGPTDENMLLDLRNIFRENFYLEVQHHPQQVQIDRNKWMVELSKKHRLPLIYGTDSHYIKKEEKELRNELLLSARISYGSEDEFLLYSPTSEEAYEMLKVQGVLNRAQIEEAMENTLILREFEGLYFTNEKKIPNPYPGMTIEDRNKLYKKIVCNEYLRKSGMPTKEEAAEIHAEMDTMTSTGTADYPLIVKQVIDKGREYGGVLTQTGRGSGASFVSNYACGFTTINRFKVPVKMYPERFISADRLKASLPDLDLNMANVEAFERAGKEILGEYGCLPMIAYGTAKTLSAFKLLARARELDFETANEVAKQIQNYELDIKHARENNADDPDYDVDDDVKIESYVEDKYLELIEESKKYKGIITSISPHPCGHILFDKDLRRETGIIRVKSKSGSKDAVYAAYIDGKTADAYNYVKMDFLRVDVVKIISDTFKLANIPIMSVNELLESVKNDKEVWQLYANRNVMGLNQVEREKSAERCSIYKPKNVAELAAFVAAIRPGFKSMLNTFINRQKFAYNIPSLDNLLATKEIPDSFLMYDEQILKILKAAGIPGPDAYACIKAVKKKKADKVASYKERFKEGFTKVLEEQEGATEEKAHKTVEQIWRIINDSANYLFCSAHSFSMSCDSLYAAWLKVHYPYELYVTMLKLYDEKKNTDKISSIIAEMKRYKNISLSAGRFGQDNTDWVMDKENQTISQSLSSIRYLSKQAARDLKRIGKKKMIMVAGDPDDEIIAVFEDRKPETEYKEVLAFDTFTDVLRALQMDTCLDTRQIKILIELGYFKDYGGSGKLMKVYNNFFEGKLKLTKTIKSYEPRLQTSREYEESLPDEELPISQRLFSELSNVGLCMSIDKSQPANLYFVRDIDTRYGVKANIYSVQRGTTGVVRFRKNDFAKKGFEIGDCFLLTKYTRSPRYTYKGGERAVIPGEYDIWVNEYSVLPNENKGE